MKESVQYLVRDVHTRFFDRGLPHSIAIYFHDIEVEDYAAFEESVTYFGEQGYRFTNPEEFLSEAFLPRRLFISFDDNCRGWHHAFSVFEKLKLKITFYVNTFPLRDRASPSDIIEYYQRIAHRGAGSPLSATELRELAGQGHMIGNHTYSHLFLSALPLDEAIDEIRKGRTELEAILGRPVLHFSHPFGMARHMSQELRDYCRESGVRTVATAIPGLLHSQQWPFNINRTRWDLKQPLGYNLANVRVDGAWFERLTGRSPVG